MRELTAKFDGTCEACAKPIKADTKVQWPTGLITQVKRNPAPKAKAPEGPLSTPRPTSAAGSPGPAPARPWRRGLDLGWRRPRLSRCRGDVGDI